MVDRLLQCEKVHHAYLYTEHKGLAVSVPHRINPPESTPLCQSHNSPDIRTKGGPLDFALCIITLDAPRRGNCVARGIDQIVGRHSFKEKPLSGANTA